VGGEKQMDFDQNYFGGMNFIVNQNDFVGVFKVINYRDYNGFVLKLEVYKFLKSNQYVLDNIIQQNTVNPTDSKLLDRVSSERIHNDSLNYKEAKSYLEYLPTVIRWSSENNQNLINLNIMNKMSIVLTIDQIKQFYYVIKSFIENYFILESMFDMLSKLGEVKETPINTNYAGRKVTDFVKTSQDEPEQVQQYIQNQKEQKPKDDFEILLEYCYNKHLKNLVIHYSLNYYRYVSNKSFSIDCDQNIIKIILPNILPYSLSMDSKYFYDYLLSDKSIPLNNITIYATKLLKKVLFEGNDVYIKNSIYIMSFAFILLVYCIRYLTEIYPAIFETQYELIVSNSNNLQKRIIQHYANSYLKSLNLPKHDNGKDYVLDFEINPFNLYEQWELKEDELIKKLSDENSHIIPISQELFVKTVMGKLDESDKVFQHPQFNFSDKKILDLNSLIKQDKRITLKKSSLIDPNSTVETKMSDDLILTDYLNYNNNNEEGLITKAFKYVMDYSKDPSSVNFVKDLPKEILNLFPVISKDILTKNKLLDQIDNTYDYYRIVIDNIPSPESIRYTTLLFIVYQIIIPYYYLFHKKTTFVDCLL
jgi:hypothetical protein